MKPLILREPEVAAATSLSPDTIRRLVAGGQFPRPLRLSQRAVGWLSAEVDAWIEARVAQRDNQRAAA